MTLMLGDSSDDRLAVSGANGSGVDIFFEVTADALKAGDKVVFPGTFKAEVSERKARTGRNPLTGAEMKIPAKKVIKAKLSDKLLG